MKSTLSLSSLFSRTKSPTPGAQSDDANAMGGTLGLGVPGAGPGIGGSNPNGFENLLGLNGGKGLFGMGAATLPVLGIFAGMGYGLWDFFHKHRNIAPTTPDALANNASPDLYFNTTPFAQISQTLTKIGNQISTSMNKVSTAMTGLTTAPPGQVMKDNFTAIKDKVTTHVADALGNDRGFRRTVAGAVLQQSL